ncbi:MAG: response regulator transcription factor [Bacilli bacterium]|nr:response regulator transcription factor [Bacilli bacterium]
MRLLVVEDEYKLADVIASKLKQNKYQVDVANDGEEGLDLALSDSYDLIILDVMLPKVNGFEILKEIREEKIDTKVIMLTAKVELEDKLHGFNYGANDYVTKPFHIEELLARVNAQLNTANNINSDYLEVGNTRLNTKTSTIENIDTNETIDIIGKEFQLLEYFMRNKKQVIEKDQIYNKIWGFDNEIESNNLEAYLSFIRKKLKLLNSNINIKAIRGMGYKLEVVDD